MHALRTLPEALARAARGTAGYCFVLPDGERWLSYADLHAASLRASGTLHAAGSRRGELVGLVLPDAEQFLTTLFGASAAGFTPASIPPPATGTQLGGSLQVAAGPPPGAR